MGNYIIYGLAIAGACAVIITLVLKKDEFVINKNGIIVKAKTKRYLSSKDFVNYLKEVILYVEEAKEQYVDDVIGIKNRYFKQSKDFAKSRIDSVKNDIIEEYKVAYMEKYTGTVKVDLANSLPTKLQIDEETDQVSPCQKICSFGCNSGLSFFESKLQKDFKPILEEVYRIIEENHLVNRADREYEEEIMTKAEQLSSYLKNIILSYPVPIDNSIAREVISNKCHDVKDAIADSLRRSRTLSVTKREEIEVEKKKYIKRRDNQISQIITILSEEDTSAVLSSCNMSLDD